MRQVGYIAWAAFPHEETVEEHYFARPETNEGFKDARDRATNRLRYWQSNGGSGGICSLDR